VKGHGLGMVGPDAFGLLMGRFAAHNRMELAEEAYAHTLNLSNNQSRPEADVRPSSSFIYLFIYLSNELINMETKQPKIRQRDFEHLIAGLAHKGETERALAFLHQLSPSAESSAHEASSGIAGVVKSRKPVGPDTFETVIRALAR
jgi:hypothetical protein